MFKLLEGLFKEVSPAAPVESYSTPYVLVPEPPRVLDVSEPVLAIVKSLSDINAWDRSDSSSFTNGRTVTLIHKVSGLSLVFKQWAHIYGICTEEEYWAVCAAWMTEDEKGLVLSAFNALIALQKQRVKEEKAKQAALEREEFMKVFVKEALDI